MPVDLHLGNLGASNLIAGIIFSGVGFVAFNYGRKEGEVRLMGLGGALMVYSYFTPNTLMTCLVGAALTGAIFLARD